jgi:DNA invertase Pin-like site-specific DNA recombinase
MNRPGVLKVLAAAAEGRIDLVIVEGLYLLARDPKDLRGILDMLSSRGIIVMRGDM